jgi:S1-C subfamily serine protease
MPEPTPTRRALLGGLGAAALGALAGCTAPVGSRTLSGGVEPTATAAAESPYTRVYRDTIDSVVLVQVTGPTLGGQGSGFVLDSAGHVLTNQHVVAGAERIDLRFSDGSWRSATVIGTDVYSDLAVVSVEGPIDAGALPFVDRVPPIGTEVVAIGSPFGLEESLSTGVVSGNSRLSASCRKLGVKSIPKTSARTFVLRKILFAPAR